TPPVALACFAAAPIAKETGLKISLWAIRIAVAGFIVPYMAVYNPSLMLQGDNLWMTAYMLFKAAVAIGLWGIASIGHLQAGLAWWERLLAFAGGVALILALPVTDELGFALAALVLGQHLWRHRHVPAVAA
ncbi:MAG: TRAP transporter permease, partial [Pseudomonadaceae bacterium]|nr:TRAP transporter permease [Pseudomonadaceae bacterium]